jgi:hypothetical protein
MTGVDDRLGMSRFAEARHEPLKRRQEPLRIEPAEKPAAPFGKLWGGMAGHAILELEKPTQEWLFRLREQAMSTEPWPLHGTAPIATARISWKSCNPPKWVEIRLDLGRKIGSLGHYQFRGVFSDLGI